MQDISYFRAKAAFPARTTTFRRNPPHTSARQHAVLSPLHRTGARTTQKRTIRGNSHIPGREVARRRFGGSPGPVREPTRHHTKARPPQHQALPSRSRLRNPPQDQQTRLASLRKPRPTGQSPPKSRLIFANFSQPCEIIQFPQSVLAAHSGKYCQMASQA